MQKELLLVALLISTVFAAGTVSLFFVQGQGCTDPLNPTYASCVNYTEGSIVVNIVQNDEAYWNFAPNVYKNSYDNVNISGVLDAIYVGSGQIAAVLDHNTPAPGESHTIGGVEGDTLLVYLDGGNRDFNLEGAYYMLNITCDGCDVGAAWTSAPSFFTLVLAVAYSFF